MVAVIPKFMPNFQISLTVSNVRVKSRRWHNLFQVTKPGTNHFKQPGNRMAAIYFNGRRKYFHIITDRNGKPNNYVNKRIHKTSQDGSTAVFAGPYYFQFIQEENKDGKYVIKITMNGETLVNEINSEPKTVDLAELYVAYRKPHRYLPLDAEIHEFKLQTGKTNFIIE